MRVGCTVIPMTLSRNTEPDSNRASSLPVLPASWANLFSTTAIRIDPPGAFPPSDSSDSNSFRWTNIECVGCLFHNEGKAACIFHAPPSRDETQLPFQETNCLFPQEIARSIQS